MDETTKAYDPAGPWSRTAPVVEVRCICDTGGAPHYLVTAGCKKMVAHTMAEVTQWLKDRVIDWTWDLCKIGALPRPEIGRITPLAKRPSEVSECGQAFTNPEAARPWGY